MSDSVDVSAVLNSEDAPQVEETSEVVVEEVSAPSEVEEEAPVVPSTQEVVQNVQEILSSTDTSAPIRNAGNV